MVGEANGLALEVLADGIFLAGDDAFRQEIEQLAVRTGQRLGIERTPLGWRMAHWDDNDVENRYYPHPPPTATPRLRA
jgi:hypothetical protein